MSSTSAYHESFPQPADQSVLAWRYIDTPKLLALLLRREIYLRRLDLLPDQFEGTHSKPTRSILLAQLTVPRPTGAGLSQEQAAQIVGQMMDTTQITRRTFFVSCWHLGPFESEAMWRLYCGLREGVALVLPYGRLRESVSDESTNTYVGAVTYIDYETKLIPPENIFNLAMHKRAEFSYEREARILRWSFPIAGGEFQAARMPDSMAIPWDAEQLLERIVVTPYAEDWYLETLRGLMQHIAPALVDRIVPSIMSKQPLEPPASDMPAH
jgi:hypothetical protein